MAECNVSIDKNNLPGVKEVCKDFAVLEDHCLAYNLQEQEIESHLASNVNKSRLVQKDLQVAKKLQEEEDQRAKVQKQRRHVELERQDIEIAQEIQDQLVRQAEQQRQQEENDAAIARKLQEKEMKEERKRQKQLEANFEEEYFEDHGAARRPLDVDKHARHKSTSPGRHDPYAPVSSHRDYSPDYSSSDLRRHRYPRQDPAAPHSHVKHHEHYLAAEGGRSRHADPYPEHLLPSRGKHGDRYPDYEPTETGRDRGYLGEDPERVVRRKERPVRPPPPQSPVERDKAWDRERDRQRARDRGRDLEWERQMGRDQRRDREQDHRRVREGRRDRERSQDRGQSWDRHRERERHRQRDKDNRQRARTRSRERGLDEEPRHHRERPREGRSSWETDEDDFERERRARGRQRVHSGPEEVFDELRSDEERVNTKEFWDTRQGEGPDRKPHHSQSSEETGRIVHRGSGAVIAETEFELNEATKGLTKLDIREQELKDMEVARKLQDEEIKASKMHGRAAQVAQDEEIARLMMEQEKREYKKEREKEKEKEREKERERLAMEKMAMERRRPEGDYRPNSEEVVRPRTRDESEYQRQRNHNKPARPPQPRPHDYENVNSGYGYMDQPGGPRAPARPDAAYKGAYYKR